jgi:fructose-bisphosphate aldolase class 1
MKTVKITFSSPEEKAEAIAKKTECCAKQLADLEAAEIVPEVAPEVVADAPTPEAAPEVAPL